ncbi:DNRLRE domain-containing protein [Bacillus pinisoli]|uniref:DNRLRE domain-containing protein n=1 Tax=Bacillus pinisoli TaxID=2901866 RepID=UPI001FF2FC50|nr:DNRLRE domain-containing protein [Bacillus pinisoli]
MRGKPGKSFTIFLYVLVFILVIPSIQVHSEQEQPSKHTVVDVTASGHDGNFPENTLDDNLSTRWSSQGRSEWVLYDLGSSKEVGYVGLAFYKGDSRQSYFDIQVSTDGVNWSTVLTDGISKEGEAGLVAYDIEDSVARYVKIVGKGNTSNDWNSLTVTHLYRPSESGDLLLMELVPPKPEEREDVTYTVPGLVNPDGSKHPIHKANKVVGKRWNVIDFGADPSDSGQDDLPAILAAIEAASAGDEVFLPKGTYNLKSTLPNDGSSHIALKSGVNIRGESQKHVFLVSDFDADDSSGKVFRAYGMNNIVISHLTITSTFNGNYSSDSKQNNPDRGGPVYGIYIADGFGNTPSSNILIEHVTIEKYQRMGVRIENSHDIVVQHALFQNATDVGGGGAGYGVSIQGVPKVDRTGYKNDTRFNVVRNSVFKGPYIRHGTLLQYYAHNNEIYNNTFENTVLDAIDLHGEDEYLNEIYQNTISGIITGAGIGVGNTGGTAPSNHDASGPYNYIHDNKITNSREGIKVYLGSPNTIIENNTIMNSTEPSNAKGIYILNAPGTIIKDNKIMNNKAEGFVGILLAHDNGDSNSNNIGSGDPTNITISGNQIKGNTNGIRVEAGSNIFMNDNDVSKSVENDYYLNFQQTKQDEDILGEEEVVIPSADAIVDIERPTSNYGLEDPNLTAAGSSDKNYYKYFNVKSNSDFSKGRVAFFKFEVNNLNEIRNVLFELSGKIGSNTTSVELDVYGLTNDQWNEETITWENAPNLATDSVKVTGIGETATLLGHINVATSETEKINIDVTDFVKAQSDGKVTLMVVDTIGQNGNVNIYSKDESNESRWPALIIGK